MTRRTPQPKNVIFWGAGATRELGIRTTAEQGKFIRCITGASTGDKRLVERIKEALGADVPTEWRDAFYDLITILGDTNAAYDSIGLSLRACTTMSGGGANAEAWWNVHVQ